MWMLSVLRHRRIVLSQAVWTKQKDYAVNSRAGLHEGQNVELLETVKVKAIRWLAKTPDNPISIIQNRVQFHVSHLKIVILLEHSMKRRFEISFTAKTY